MIKTQLKVINQKGMHARACSELSNLANTFEADISLEFNQQTADAKNILQLMMLAAAKGSSVTMSCSGNDEQACTNAIKMLFENFFGEEN